MRLTPEETKAINRKEPIKVWRFEDPRASTQGEKYVSGPHVYTVLDKRMLTPSDVMRTQGRAVYEALRVSWPPDATHTWLIVLLRGDHTDKPRLLRKGPKAGYTDDPRMAMFGEPEAIPAQEAETYAKQARAIRDAALREIGSLDLEQIEEMLKVPGLRREERQKLRHVRYTLRKLGGRT